MAAFKYEPLDLDGPSFRLLRLRKGSGLDIECELFQASFASDDLVPYEALSYTWGGRDFSASVQINQCTLAVTENLYLALQYLRSWEADRILWVDAICMDQGNSQERGHQVGYMGTIFSRADRVIFWLGSPTDDTDILMDSLKQLEEKSTQFPCSRWSLKDKRWTELWSSLQLNLTNQHWDLATRQSTGLKTLLARPWFKRVWILQEVANARRALVSSGTRSLSARIFALAPILLNIRPESHCQAVLDIMPGPSRTDSWWNQKRDLYTLLQKFRNSKAGDARDMIFALLGISSDMQDTDCLRADYEKSVEQVVRETISLLFSLPDYPCHTISEFLLNFRSLNRASLKRLASLYDANHTAKFLEQRRDGTEVTMAVLEAAAGNKQYGAEVMRFLLEQSKTLSPISTPVVKAAAANTRSGAEVTRLLFEHGRLENPITKEVIEAAAGNVESGARVMTLLLQHYGEKTFEVAACCREGVMELLLQQDGVQTKLTEGTLRAAARNKDSGPAVMRLLLEQRKYQVLITSRVVEAAAFNRKSGSEVLKLLLEPKFGSFEIHQAFITNLVRNIEPNDLELILKKRGHEIQITSEVVHLVSGNAKAEQVMEVIVRQRAEGFEITPSLIIELAQSFGPIPMELLLTKRGDEIKITEELFKEICNHSRGQIETITVLLKHWGDEVRITEEVIKAAAGNWRCGAQIVRVLFPHWPAEVEITEEVIKVAAGNWAEGLKVMKLLLGRQGKKLVVTEEVMRIAAGNERCARPLLKLFLQHQGEDIILTEEVIKAALSNEWGGVDTVELLLMEHAERFVVNEGLIIELARSFKPTLIKLLLEQRGHEVNVTEEVLEAAAGNKWCGKEIMVLLEQRRDEVGIAEDMIK
jgi:hypothetical protein